MADKTEISGKIISVVKDTYTKRGTNEKVHKYDFGGEGKKFYRWIVTLDNNLAGAVRKTVSDDIAPCNVGDILTAMMSKTDKQGVVFSSPKYTNAEGKPVEKSGSFKSSYNDPVVTKPKYWATSISKAMRILSILLEWTMVYSENVDPFHVKEVKNEHIKSMAKTIHFWITDSKTNFDRDYVELRIHCLDLAINCMNLPSYTHLKGNDEHYEPQPGGGEKLIVDKKLVIKLLEQAEHWWTVVNTSDEQ